MPDPLAAALAGIEKQWGKGSVIMLGSAERQAVDVIPTGSIGLDIALGVGGIPRGRVTEMYGPESGGKTTLALGAVAKAQQMGLRAAFIDAEHALNPAYAAGLGCDIATLYVAQPGTGEEALEITDSLVQSGMFGIIVIDSVAALVPRAEIEGEMGDSHVGLQARLMSQALRKLTGHVAAANTSLVFINQLREKVGVFFGSPEVTTGGKALKFYASVRLDIRRIETLKDARAVPVGNKVRVKVVKNKLAAPFRQAEFDLMFGQGISRGGELQDLGALYGVLRKAGSYLYLGEDQLGNGREAIRATLEAQPELAAQVEIAVREAMAAAPVTTLAVPPGSRPVPAVPQRQAAPPDLGIVG